MLADPNYLGFGDFGNLWGIVMLIKHLLIVGMIFMGFFFNAILRVGALMSSNTDAGQAIARLGLYSKWIAICGVLVLFLTALAQFESSGEIMQ